MASPFETAQRQRQQLERFLAYHAEGHFEGPVRLDTYLTFHQQKRLAWLKANCVGEILEVGCSWGFVLAICKGHAGVDVNPRLIALADALAPDREFKVADACQLPYPDKSFDTVMLPEVIEHLSVHNARSAIIEAIRVARRRILITTPDGEHDTEEATNLKHQYLVDSIVLPQLQALIPNCRTFRDYPFIFLRGDVDA